MVERLAPVAEKPEVKDWLLREGFKNSIMNEYLAYTCATSGGLLAAIQQEEIDPQLLDSAGQIIHALLIGGPAEGLDHY